MVILQKIVQNSFESIADSKQRNRELDKRLGQQYREDPSASGMTYQEYKNEYFESIKIKRMKTRYSAFEPLPYESASDFKKRMRSITLFEPIETIEEYHKRVGKVFHK